MKTGVKSALIVQEQGCVVSVGVLVVAMTNVLTLAPSRARDV